MTKIKLGDKVKDIYSGFVGVIVAKTEYINGCIQFEVVSKVGKDNIVKEGLQIDSESLEVIKPKVKKKRFPKPPTGGQRRIINRYRS